MKTHNLTKKVAEVLLITVTVLTLAGCSGTESADTESAAAEESEPAAESEPAGNDTSAENEPDAEESEPAQSEEPVARELDVNNLSETQQNMLAPMDCYSAVTDTYRPYDQLDQGTVWEALYLIIVNYTDVFGSEVTRDDDTNSLVVPDSVLVDCAYAMFDGFDGSLPVNGYGENINIEGSNYIFMDSDRGDSATRISAWTDEADGTCTVETEVYSESDGEIYNSYRFTLGPDSHSAGSSDPLFAYTVTGMEKLENETETEDDN